MFKNVREGYFPLDIKDRDVVEWVREAIVSRGINIPAKSIKSIKSYKATGDIDYFDKVAGTFIDRFYAVYGEGSEPDFVDGEFVGRFDGIYQGLIFEGIDREMEEYEWAELEGEFKGSFHDLASEDNSFFLGEFVGRDLKHYGYVIRVRGFFEGRFYDDGYSSL